MAKTWFNMARVESAANKAANSGPTAKISIYDEIGYWGVTAKNFRDQLAALGDDIEEIHLSINSPGGSVLDGFAIYNMLKKHPARVVAEIDSLAASMASVIVMAADEVRMPANAFMMIHNPWTITMGDAEELRDTADRLDKMGQGIIKAYVDKTGLSEDEVKDLMGKESWLTGEECQALGFCDVITDALEAAALSGAIVGAKDALERAGLSLPQAISLEPNEPETSEEAESVEDEEPEAEAPVTTEAEPTNGGILDRLSQLFVGRVAKQAAGAVRQPDLEALNARLTDLSERNAALLSERAGLLERIEQMESEAKAVEALVIERLAECGFADVTELPTPQSTDEPARGTAQGQASKKASHYGVASVTVGKTSN